MSRPRPTGRRSTRGSREPDPGDLTAYLSGGQQSFDMLRRRRLGRRRRRRRDPRELAARAAPRLGRDVHHRGGLGGREPGVAPEERSHDASRLLRQRQPAVLAASRLSVPRPVHRSGVVAPWARLRVVLDVLLRVPGRPVPWRRHPPARRERLRRHEALPEGPLPKGHPFRFSGTFRAQELEPPEPLDRQGPHPREHGLGPAAGPGAAVLHARVRPPPRQRRVLRPLRGL